MLDVGGSGSLMSMGSKGWPEWCDPNEELLYCLRGKKNTDSDKKVSESVMHTICCMRLHNCRPVRMSTDKSEHQM